MGGSSTYEILNMPTNSKIAGAGGYNISTNTGDPGIGVFNPSMIDSSYKNNISTGYGALFLNLSDIKYGYTSYANRYKRYNYFANLVLINYGKIDATDESGNSLGKESASEYVLSFGASEKITEWLSWGLSAKPIMSYIANYSSYALASDIGLTMHDSTKNTTLCLVARNMGFQIKPYYKGSRENLPFEIDLGYTKRFEHAPLRLSVTYRHLQKFDLTYTSDLTKTNSMYTTENQTESKSGVSDFAEKFVKHLIVGADLLLGKRFYASLGYNVKRKSELKSASNGGLVGLSYGAGMKVSKLTISFAHQKYNISGGSTTFTVMFNIDDMMKPSTPKPKTTETSSVN